jgi:hypothetical protein
MFFTIRKKYLSIGAEETIGEGENVKAVVLDAITHSTSI